MYMKGLTKYAERGLLAAISEAKAELNKLEKMLEKVRNGNEAQVTNLQKAWRGRKKYKKLSRKQMVAMKRNAALARKALAEKNNAKVS